MMKSPPHRLVQDAASVVDRNVRPTHPSPAENEYVTRKTVNAKFWSCLPGQSLQNLESCSLFAGFMTGWRLTWGGVGGERLEQDADQ
jgi:hypothetical protein